MILFPLNLFVVHEIQGYVRIMMSLSAMSTESIQLQYLQHRVKDINSKNKTVEAFALPGNNHSVVKHLDNYLSLLPSDASYFYMRAKDKAPPSQSVSSFANQRIGINILKNILPELSGIQVRYTNHSLQATAIMWMFNGQMDEKVIAETSDHESLKSLKSYEHTCKEKLQNVSRVLNETRNTDTTVVVRLL